jgi:hypothetical protein
MFCFTLCSISGSAGKPLNIHADTPGFGEFHDLIWNGRINLANHEEKLQYALVHMKELRNNMQTRRYDESLHLVSAHHKLR